MTTQICNSPQLWKTSRDGPRHITLECMMLGDQISSHIHYDYSQEKRKTTYYPVVITAFITAEDMLHIQCKCTNCHKEFTYHLTKEHKFVKI